MSEALLLQQSLLLSGTVVALLLLRPLLKRLGGAPALYLGWMAVPLVLLSPALPRPAATALPLAYTVQLGGWSAAAATAPAGAAIPTALPWLSLWALGAFALALLLAGRQWQFQRQVRRRRLPAGHSPAWVGLLKPRLLLPSDFRARFSPEERCLIRAHERVHAQRQDNLWNLLAALLWLLHWFNPLAWWALRRFRADQELAADAAVLRAQPEQTGRYLRTLAKAQPGAATPLAISPFAPHPLIERITMLQSLSRRVARPWLAVLSCLALLGSAWALTPPAAPASGPAGQNLTYAVSSYVSDRLVDVQRVELGSPGQASVRLSSFKQKDLLVTLSGQAQQADRSQRVHAYLNLGFPRVTMSEAEGLISVGKPLQIAVDEPELRQQRAVVTIDRVEPGQGGLSTPVDPDQSGAVELELRAFVDGQSIDTVHTRGDLGQDTRIELGRDGPLPIAGKLRMQARLPAYLDLRFELQVGGRNLQPRLMVPNGELATLEFNSETDRRVVRLEVRPRRIMP
ncbi:M56 family metallopeptidase [Inhella proteolytica]|uniref:Peptidase M56 domain-containing protein n=1 Tax=Inhella proteolytica TaxID=2795029 RepID=A0A931NHY5_9BURK|nr:M56 family metallopeptidase [Inhella proteolytica]MBH9578746.1 hypothetical protein [Inhella proteolytica]